MEPRVQAVSWDEKSCVLLDQTRLPSVEEYIRCSEYPEVIDAIQRLAVRGAPAIGIAGAYAVVLAAEEATRLPKEKRDAFLKQAIEEIKSARPTAVNLSWAVNRMERTLDKAGGNDVDVLLREAIRIHHEDIEMNRKMAGHGADALPEGAVLTICNTGDLATGGIGTAFGVFHEAYRRGKISRIYATETRPVLQGMRLTVWELAKNELPFTLICDSMAALTMKHHGVTSVIAGADRIARNGDVANKVGTYALAVLARYHEIPFFIAAPSSTFDMATPTGKDIVIEERNPREILGVLGTNQPPFEVSINNPAFDVTPYELISGIICEKGVLRAPATPSNFL